MSLRTILLITIRVSLSVSFASMVYLLFKFGHTELTPHYELWIAATISGTGALIGGTLMWVGLPAEEKIDPKAARKAETPPPPEPEAKPEKKTERKKRVAKEA